MLSNMVRASLIAILSIVSFGVGAGSAVAQEDRWSGLSVSVGGGAGSFDYDLNADLTRFDAGTVFFPLLIGLALQDGEQNVSSDDWNGFGTLQAAYDQKIGNFVVGAFADFDFYPDNENSHVITGFDANLCLFVVVVPFPCPVAPDGVVGVVETDVNNMWTVGGRLGYLVTPNWLLYGLVGYSEMDVDITVRQSDPFPVLVGDQSTAINFKVDELRGITLGGGGEVRLADNLNLKFEYRYTDIEGEAVATTNTSTVGNLVAGQFTAQSINLDLDGEVHSVRAALVFKLGNPL